MEKNLNQRIGIIGAGPAGLTAAESLKAKGYTNVTLFEKNSQAGGKCSTSEFEGRAYELGAGVITANNHTVLGLAKKFGVKIEQINFSRKIIFLDKKTGKPITRKTPFTEKLSFLHQIFLRYKKLFDKYKKVAEPGLSHIPEELCIPFSEWVSQHNIPLVAKELAPFFTGFGYSYFDEVPAAYVLKYYSWATLQSFIKKAVYCFPQGIQKLWMAVAKDHHVLYDTLVQNVERSDAVTIKTSHGEFIFDSLILACPLDDALQYLDAREEEKDLFSKIIYCDYRTYACHLSDFPKQDGYIPDNFSALGKGHPVFWYPWDQRHPNSDLFTFYVLGDWKISDDDVLKNIENIVHNLGGKITKVETIAHWKYFPHVNSEEMSNGYFDKLESLQGKNSTFYVGELLNFSTVELSSEYSQKLVQKYF